MHKLAIALLMLAGCGRIGFDPLAGNPMPDGGITLPDDASGTYDATPNP